MVADGLRCFAKEALSYQMRMCFYVRNSHVGFLHGGTHAVHSISRCSTSSRTPCTSSVAGAGSVYIRGGTSHPIRSSARVNCWRK